jgi:UPF0716 protein FxsA
VFLALAVLICWPLVELFVAIEVGRAIGAPLTVLLLIASWPLGYWALRSQGGAAWRRLSAAVAAGRAPGREVVDGGLIVLGGVLMIIPGFITDVIGLCLLIPASRALMRLGLIRNFQSRLVVQATRFTRRPYDVDSTATDVDQPKLRP